MSDPEQASSRSLRRNMTSVACQECRRRKVKCDGQRPCCQRCLQSVSHCVYDVSEEHTTRLRALRAKNSDMSRELQQLRDLVEALTATSKSQRDDVLNHFHVSKDVSSTLALARNLLPRVAVGVPIAHQGAAQDDVHTTHCLSHLSSIPCRQIRQLPIEAWQQLFDVFWKHYSADLPFVHRSTFLDLCCSYEPSGRGDLLPTTCCACCDELPSDTTALLLAFLALTARHCPAVVDQYLWYSVNISSELAGSSDVYASSAESHLHDNSLAKGTGRCESTQARLMLIVYNCSIAQRPKALLLLGEAAISVRSMDLDRKVPDHSHDNSEPQASLTREFIMMHASAHSAEEPSPPYSQEARIEAEIRTRIFWSCYILDSQLHLGKDRRRILPDQDLGVRQHATHDEHWFRDASQSPVTMMHFGTGAITPDHMHAGSSKSSAWLPSASHFTYWPCSIKSTAGIDGARSSRGSCLESSLSLYIKASNLLTQISSWTLRGGRRIDTQQPWDITSTWNTFLRRLLRFNQTIPAQQAINSSSFQGYIVGQTASQLIHMHVARLLCQLLLHWEFIPFLPVNFNKPQGPLHFVDSEAQASSAPLGFWTSSSRECFTAASMILHLSSTCKAADALPMTPFIAYALYTATFVDLYSQSFPWMCSHVLNPLQTTTSPEEQNSIKVTTDMILAEKIDSSGLKDLQQFVRLVDKWIDTLTSIIGYFEGFKANFKVAKAKARFTMDFERQTDISLRFGGAGMGLPEYLLFERDLRDFGA